MVESKLKQFKRKMTVDLTQILQKVNLLCQIVTQAVIFRKWEEKEKKIISIAVEAVLQAPQAQSQNLRLRRVTG